MNNKAHLRPKDFDSNGDIIPMSWKEEKGDLISREALKKAIEQIAQDYVDDNFFWAKLFDLIDNAPTVDTNEPTLNESIAFNNGYELGKSERTQGEWSFNPYDGNSYCSVCQSKAPFGYKNFCPECGADMRGAK